MSTVLSNRMHLFKNSGRSNMIRDTLKKKYSDKVREKRMIQFESRRHMEHVVRETVSEEMKSDFGELDENILLDLYDSIINSLIQEQYEEIRHAEEEQLAADVEEFMDPSVLCPSCLLSPLSVDERYAKCQGCPFLYHFDGKSKSPTRSDLRRLLSEAFLTHEVRKCDDQPRATEIDGKLALHCENCGFNMVII